MTQISTEQVRRRDTPVTCEACGRRVARKSRQQKFCSDNCRQFAQRENRASQLEARTAIKNSVNGMVRPCSCPASDESGKGLQRQRSTPCPRASTAQSP